MADAAVAGKRVALVIGNSGYDSHGPLPNPKNDASDIAEALKRLGFAVSVGIDATRADLNSKVAKFVGDIESADTALFFYAGHGLQLDGVNYLVPVDAEITRETDVVFHTQKLDDILNAMMQTSKASLIFLDACRNNPFMRSLRRAMNPKRGAELGDGLATIQLHPNGEALIAYATQPNNTADDGKGRNSPFTKALLQHIERPGLTVEDVLKRVGRDVKTETNGEQIPWYNSSLFYELEFNPVAGSTEADRVPSNHPWLALKQTSDPSRLRGFIDNFPEDTFAAEARRRLGDLEAESWNVVRDQRTLAQLEGFLSRFPKGHYSEEAERRLVVLQKRAVLIFVGLALLTGLISGYGSVVGDWLSIPLAFNYLSPVFAWGGSSIGVWWNLGVFLFSCAMVFAFWKWWPVTRQRMLAFVVITMFGWLAAHVSYQLLAVSADLSIQDIHKLSVRGNTPSEAVRITSSYEFVMRFLITAAASAIGAAITFWGAAVMSSRVRRGNVLAAIVAGAALSPAPMMILAANNAEGLIQVAAMFVAWQVWVGGYIGWTCVRAFRSGQTS